MINIPRSEFTFSFSRSSGAGGQNVNKVNSKATLEWDMKNSNSIFPGVKLRFEAAFSRYMVGEKVVISSQVHRSQNMNIEECISKLHALLKQVQFPPKDRRPTKPTKSSIKKRLESKTVKSKIKKLRQEKF